LLNNPARAHFKESVEDCQLFVNVERCVVLFFIEEKQHSIKVSHEFCSFSPTSNDEIQAELLDVLSPSESVEAVDEKLNEVLISMSRVTLNRALLAHGEVLVLK
jgi:hypothetical protein